MMSAKESSWYLEVVQEILISWCPGRVCPSRSGPLVPGGGCVRGSGSLVPGGGTRVVCSF